ncbi:MAG: FAD-dependent oxidoreductase [Gemmatimonadales bacterium]
MAASRLLLVGAGLPHLVVLEALGRHRAAGAEVTLVAREPVIAHPGMVPGYLAGRYALEDLRVDLAEAAAAAGATFVRGEIATLDAASRTGATTDGVALAWDIASIAQPAGTAGDGRPGHAHSAATFSGIAELAEALDRLAGAPGPEPRRIVIIGAGESGVELALAIRARLDRKGAGDVMITMLESRSELFGGRMQAWADRIEQVLAERDVMLRLGTGAGEIGADFVRLSDGRVQPADLVVSVPAPSPWPPAKAAGLPVDHHGFLLLDDTLQLQGQPALFGAGPGSALLAAPRAPMPAAAQLRMGRVLARNLGQALSGHDPTHRFRVRERELTLLDAGDGRAVLLGGPVATVSRWALRYKQLGDRRLVTRLRSGRPRGNPPSTQP